MTDWNPSITPQTAARRLHRWGYYLRNNPDKAERTIPKLTDWTGYEMETAIADFQTTFEEEILARGQRLGLMTIDKGHLDVVTETLINTQRCARPDFEAVAEANWPDVCRNRLTYAMLFTLLSPLDQADTQKAFDDALWSWTERMDLVLKRDNTLGREASIWSTASRLAGSTLAWSVLAENTCQAHLEQRYNTSVNWTIRYLQGVVAHEVGHALGMQHINDPKALLYPYARPELYLPQELDLQQMERLGYARRTQPPDPPPPPPPPPPPGPLRVVSAELIYNDGSRQTLAADGGTGTDWEGVARTIYTGRSR